MERGKTGSGQPGGDKAYVWAAGRFGGEKSGQRTDDHRSFNPKIENARAFGKDLTQGGVENRGSRLDSGRQKRYQNFNVHGLVWERRFDRR